MSDKEGDAANQTREQSPGQTHEEKMPAEDSKLHGVEQPEGGHNNANEHEAEHAGEQQPDQPGEAQYGEQQPGQPGEAQYGEQQQEGEQQYYQEPTQGGENSGAAQGQPMAPQGYAAPAGAEWAGAAAYGGMPSAAGMDPAAYQAYYQQWYQYYYPQGVPAAYGQQMGGMGGMGGMGAAPGMQSGGSTLHVPQQNKVFVGGLPYSLTEMELLGVFQKYGGLSANIITDRETGRSRGFGFVAFPDEHSANEATAALNGTTVGGRSIRVGPATKRNNAF